MLHFNFFLKIIWLELPQIHLFTFFQFATFICIPVYTPNVYYNIDNIVICKFCRFFEHWPRVKPSFLQVKGRFVQITKLTTYLIVLGKMPERWRKCCQGPNNCSTIIIFVKYFIFCWNIRMQFFVFWNLQNVIWWLVRDFCNMKYTRWPEKICTL